MGGARRPGRLSAFVALSLALHGALLWQLGDSAPSSPAAAPPEPVSVSVVAMRPPAPPAPPEAAPPNPPPPEPRVSRPRPRAAKAPARKVVPVPETPPEPPREPEPAQPEPPAPAAEAGPSPTRPDVAAPPPSLAAVAPGAAPEPATPDEIEAYKNLVRRLIASRKHYPTMARRRGLEGDVTVQLRIADDGGLDAVQAAGRGGRLFERAALDAVRLAVPFPPPPPEFGDFEVVIRYRLDD